MHVKLKIRKFLQGFYFRETLHMQSFVKIKSSRNGKITLSFTYVMVTNFYVTNMSFKAIRKIFGIYSSITYWPTV